jgi:hypothetical protein
MLRIMITKMSYIPGTNLRYVEIFPGPEVTNVLKNSPETKRQNLNKCSHVRFDVFTEVTMKNAVFLDVAPCRSCVNRRFGGTYRLHLRSSETNVSSHNIYPVPHPRRRNSSNVHIFTNTFTFPNVFRA